MAALALAAVGSAIGSATITGTVLGMSGASFGWMVGSMAGSLLFPPKAPDGPRLEDKTVQVSTYGQPIPRIYGTQRLAGNVLWSTELIETATEQDGKGGPSYTTYSYRASFAVSVCRGPVAGIRRIWADGKLIFDQSETNTGPQKDYEAASLAIYTGTESQLPDPTLQALQGDVPAYRGQVYVVFTDLQLAKFGNRLPSLTFEVVQSGTWAVPVPEVVHQNVGSYAYNRAIIEPNTGNIWQLPSTTSGPHIITVVDPVKGQLVKNITLVGSTGTLSDLAYCPATHTVWVLGEGGYTTFVYVVGCDSLSLLQTLTINSSGGAIAWIPTRRCMFVAAGNFMLNRAAISIDPYSFDAQTDFTSSLWAYRRALFVEQTSTLFLQSGAYLEAYDVFGGAYRLVASFNVGGASGPSTLALDTRRRRLIALGSGSAYTLVSIDTLQASTGVFDGKAPTSVFYSKILDAVFTTTAAGGPFLTRRHAQSLASERDIALPSPSVVGASGLNQLLDRPELDDRLYAGVPGYSPPRTVVVYLSDRLTSQPAPLAGVVAAESALVGLAAADIDVSALTTVQVAGFAVTSQGSVRSALEQLMMAYAFDAVESGGKVKFVRRGGPVVATLADGELAAHQPGNAVPAPLPITRAEEVELPQRITVRYSNPAADYQVGAQSAQRLTGRAMAQQGVDLPIVLTDDQARQVAEAALFSAWAARSTASFSTTMERAALEPCDVVSVGGNTLRITRRTENAGLLNFEAAFENGAVYTQVAQGAEADIHDQSIPLRSKTALEFLDVPPLRDQDDDAGFYLAASGYTSGWDGALVYKSSDGGSSYDEFMLMPSAAIVGTALDELGSWAQNTFDEVNSVTVTLRSGQLSSLSELAVLNGGNAALLGGEIIQFKNATLNADGSYTLRGLLRGRKGTPTAGHAAGDRFVLLNTSGLRRAPAAASEVGLERLYKPVSIGATLASATAKAFTNTAQALKPLAPVHLGGGRSSGGNVLISWVRRTRIGSAWRDYADAPLAEAAESYEVDVFADATYTTIKRTLASSTSSVTYTATQQTTDFGSTQAVVYVRVYQLSATAGRGRALQGSI